MFDPDQRRCRSRAATEVRELLTCEVEQFLRRQRMRNKYVPRRGLDMVSVSAIDSPSAFSPVFPKWISARSRYFAAL
jgi:hypothetical protein